MIWTALENCNSDPGFHRIWTLTDPYGNARSSTQPVSPFQLHYISGYISRRYLSIPRSGYDDFQSHWFSPYAGECLQLFNTGLCIQLNWSEVSHIILVINGCTLIIVVMP
ncbi:MAG: hypothetical protein IPP15_07175 [Saprospiraceae bacterium]|uniref:Uncharacterized protein n=1 Tax=Candidatus Opimibacter skivensis TaxID=2982028 RepID=A0A9D7XNG8_9BACT|nr:hypothetical protein [Candidatus Opimibacter skivensis]